MYKVILTNIFLLLILTGLSAQVEINGDELGQLLKEKRKKILTYENFSYTGTLKLKKMGSQTFSEQDLIFSAVKNDSNTIYHYDWHIIKPYKEGKYWTFMCIEEDFHWMKHDLKEIDIQPIHEVGSGTYFLTMRRCGLFDEIINFLSENPYENYTLNSEQGLEYWILNHIDGITKTEIWIDKKTLFPIRKKISFERDNLEQVTITEIKDLKFNDESIIQKFDIEEYLENYEVNHVEKTEPDLSKLLEKKNTLGEKELENFYNSYLYENEIDSIKIKEIEGKLFLFDFWYMSCLPCLEAMPRLQELHDKHHNNGLQIIGVNCFDKGSNYLLEKLKERGITYTNLFGSKARKDNLQIKAFPTLFLTNSQGELLYTGHDFNLIDELIQKELN